MNTKQKASRILMMVVLWAVILGGLWAGYEFLYKPWSQDSLQSSTSSESQFKESVTLWADGFGGYALWRSNYMRNLLADMEINFIIKDDKAIYNDRMEALQDGDAQMALFPINSMITSEINLGKDRHPGTFVAIVDATVGADAAWVYAGGVIKSINDLNHPDAVIYAVKDSPSEYFARVIKANFGLMNMGPNWLKTVETVDDLYREFSKSNKDERKLFIGWEPLVTKAKKNGAVVILSTQQMKGHIIDMLAAQRVFLTDHRDLVRAVIEVYFRTVYYYMNNRDELLDLLVEDAKQMGSPINRSDAEAIAAGIEWKNTRENYAHFGVLARDEAGGIQNIESMINNIMEVLVATKAVSREQLTIKPHEMFYNGILTDMKADGFHPGQVVSVIDGVNMGETNPEVVRSTKALAELNQSQWRAMIPVGNLYIEPIQYGRGSSKVSRQSQIDLENLSKRLATWPEFYLKVTGNAQSRGDLNANYLLANERAESAIAYLVQLGVDKNKMRAYAVRPVAGQAGSQSVTFTLMQRPY